MYKLLSYSKNEESCYEDTMKPRVLVHVSSGVSISSEGPERPICTFGEWGVPSPKRPENKSSSFSRIFSSYLDKCKATDLSSPSFPEIDFFPKPKSNSYLFG